ncbi:MAG: OB-fold nucleic acid binding domain-containing protein [Myxococcales bacterium]|nr:OB-fold nucleic acid binding domain-containing protein [Myxococcales bacterium]
MRASSANLTRALVGAGLAVLLVGGCKKDTGPTPGTPPATTTAAPVAPGGTAPGGTAPHGPMGTAPAAQAGAKVGAVLETMNSGGYTYAHIDLGGSQVWAAAPETTLAVGAKVQFLGGSLMTAFHSNTLDRTFDEIYFVPGLPLEGAAAAAPAAPAPAMGGSPTAPPTVTEKIDPVAGGQTIAAMTAGAAGLAGKQVSVRGKVVKYNGGIMGKNWVHLQDGTGDMTVTTAETAAPLALGDLVVLRGTVAVGKDFGGGYSYAVIVEDATVVAP